MRPAPGPVDALLAGNPPATSKGDHLRRIVRTAAAGLAVALLAVVLAAAPAGATGSGPDGTRTTSTDTREL